LEKKRTPEEAEDPFRSRREVGDGGSWGGGLDDGGKRKRRKIKN
jgi:hypothetical protein